jgi:hypothetical protein
MSALASGIAVHLDYFTPRFRYLFSLLLDDGCVAGNLRMSPLDDL